MAILRRRRPSCSHCVSATRWTPPSSPTSRPTRAPWPVLSSAAAARSSALRSNEVRRAHQRRTLAHRFPESRRLRAVPRGSGRRCRARTSGGARRPVRRHSGRGPLVRAAHVVGARLITPARKSTAAPEREQPLCGDCAMRPSPRKLREGRRARRAIVAVASEAKISDRTDTMGTPHPWWKRGNPWTFKQHATLHATS